MTCLSVLNGRFARVRRRLAIIINMTLFRLGKNFDDILRLQIEYFTRRIRHRLGNTYLKFPAFNSHYVRLAHARAAWANQRWKHPSIPNNLSADGVWRKYHLNAQFSKRIDTVIDTHRVRPNVYYNYGVAGVSNGRGVSDLYRLIEGRKARINRLPIMDVSWQLLVSKTVSFFSSLP